MTQIFDRHPMLLVFIIAFSVAGGLTFCLYLNVYAYEQLPITRHMIDSIVVKNGYTECVFIINEKRYVTDEMPCSYKPNESVLVKVSPTNSIDILRNQK